MYSKNTEHFEKYCTSAGAIVWEHLSLTTILCLHLPFEISCTSVFLLFFLPADQIMKTISHRAHQSLLWRLHEARENSSKRCHSWTQRHIHPSIFPSSEVAASLDGSVQH